MADKFPDYDNRIVFDTALAMLKPLGFEDSTWGNDTCPSITKMTAGGDDYEFQLFVDYADPDKREDASHTNFALCLGPEQVGHSFHYLGEVVSYITKIMMLRENVAVLQDDIKHLEDQLKGLKLDNPQYRSRERVLTVKFRMLSDNQTALKNAIERATS